MKPRPKKGPHGGARAGAGRPTVFKEKAEPTPFPMVFTEAGRQLLDQLARRTKLSRNAIIGTLALQHAHRVRFTEADRFSSKGESVLAVRVPPQAAAKLRAARDRTQRSYSDIGELLLTRYAPRTKFPDPVGA